MSQLKRFLCVHQRAAFFKLILGDKVKLSISYTCVCMLALALYSLTTEAFMFNIALATETSNVSDNSC